MSLNNLPTNLKVLVQEKHLERAFADALRANLGYRQIADRVDFKAGIGETLTKTKDQLRPAKTTPTSNAGSSDLNSGMTASSSGVEQYSLKVDLYSDLAESDLVGEPQAIISKWVKDAGNMGEQAYRSIDLLSRNALYSPYLGGSTFVKTTLGSAGPALVVDNAIGFAVGDVVAVDAGSYTVLSVALHDEEDNVSTVASLGGRSGVITFTTSVTTGNGTAGKAVFNGKAAKTIRAGGRAQTSLLQAGDILTSDMLIAGVAELEMNNVPKIDGFYNLYVNPMHAASLMSDAKVLNAFQGNSGGQFRNGVVSEIYGVRLLKSHMNPAVDGVNRAMLVGKGALIEGVFTENGYRNQANLRDSGEVAIVDDVAFIITEPMDALKRWAKQSWCYIGGFVAPTDIGTSPTVLPTAGNASYKRAVILESR